MYSIYIPKYPNEKAPFEITKILNCYTKFITYDGLILSSPGYMSRTSATINMFIQNLKNDLNVTNRHWTFGLFNGMNGQSQSLGIFNIRTYHEQQLKNEGFNVINITSTCKLDHRKMLFFLQKTNPDFCYGTTLNKSNYKSFLQNFRTRAVMIGSTNQSQQSYYGGRKGQTNKGEADLLLFIENQDEENMIMSIVQNTNDNSSNRNIDNFFENIIISKSMYINKTDEQYLQDIVTDFLSNSLI